MSEPNPTADATPAPEPDDWQALPDAVFTRSVALSICGAALRMMSNANGASTVACAASAMVRGCSMVTG